MKACSPLPTDLQSTTQSFFQTCRGTGRDGHDRSDPPAAPGEVHDLTAGGLVGQPAQLAVVGDRELVRVGHAPIMPRNTAEVRRRPQETRGDSR